MYTYIDFCSGAGGPTPYIEQALNHATALFAETNSASKTESSEGNIKSNGSTNSNSNIKPQPLRPKEKAIQFVLTDLHPHIESWMRAARQSSNLSYIPEPVDAAAAPTDLIKSYSSGNKVFRLFNLAFHHFDDKLARAILKDTVETSDAVG
jgi:hypothetical protein